MRIIKKAGVILATSALFVAMMSSAAQAVIIPSDVVGYWKLDGDLTDSAGTNDGTIGDVGEGDVTFGLGFDGTASGAADFENTVDYISTPFVVPTGAKSMSLFFTTNATGFQVLAGTHGGGQRFYMAAHTDNGGPGSLAFAPGNGNNVDALPSIDFTPTGTDVATDGTYHHFVGVDDGAGGITYYYRSPSDAQHLVFVENGYTGISGGTGGFAIGQLLDLGTGLPISGTDALGATGLVDDVAVFNRQLTLAEVETIYAEGSVDAAIGVDPVQPGDFDADGDVDGADFVVWQTNFPTAMDATLADGDADGDGDVDGADFVVWQTNFPTSPGGGVAPVPEPQSLLLFVMGALAVCGLWRRDRC